MNPNNIVILELYGHEGIQAQGQMDRLKCESICNNHLLSSSIKITHKVITLYFVDKKIFANSFPQ